MLEFAIALAALGVALVSLASSISTSRTVTEMVAKWKSDEEWKRNKAHRLLCEIDSPAVECSLVCEQTGKRVFMKENDVRRFAIE